MKLIFAILAVFIASSATEAQTPSSTPSSPQGTLVVPGVRADEPDNVRHFPDALMESQFRMVRFYMRLRSPLQFGDQYLSMLGDKAAFFTFVAMGDRGRLTMDETLTALDIIHKAFAKPKFIQNSGDRDPSNALRLLDLLQANGALDQVAKDRIVQERNFLHLVPQNIAPDPMLPPGPPPERGTTPFR